MNKTGRIALGVTSAFFIGLAAAMVVASVSLAWLYGTQRDSDGYVTSSVVSLTADGYAISSANIDLESLPEGWIPSKLLGEFRVKAVSETGSDLFMGVGPVADVEAYLDGVEHSDVVRYGERSGATYVEQPGDRTPELPSAQDFWTTTTEGPGLLSLDWQPEEGSWALVVMNSDGSSGVDVSTSIGVDTPWLPIGMVVTAIGALLTGALAAVTAVVALRRPKTPVVQVTNEPSIEQLAG